MDYSLFGITVYSIIILALFSVGFIITYKLMPRLILKLNEKGIYGFDVHKLSRPKVPEMGGLGFVAAAMIVLSFALMISYFFFQEEFVTIAATIGVIFIAFIIGLFDDLKKRKGKGLGAKTKPILCLAIGIPIYYSGVYNPYLALPFLGDARLTMVYPILIFLICTVCANTFNMIDVYNGAMPGVSIIAFITILGASFIFLSFSGVLLSMIFLGILMAYYQYNKYPARIFSGDIGSLTVGAAFAVTIIFSKTELIGVIVCLPLIMNAFQTLRSFGGFKERSEVKIKPTILLPDERIDISTHKEVPLTLAGLVLVKGPLSEKDVVKIFHDLIIFSGILGIITAFLILLL
ncbi:MAG: hypothetical protein ACTSR3_02465 [Candidatus Helarchaeota archaeon]